MIYFLYGPDTYRLREKLKEIIAKHGAGFEVERALANELELGEITSRFGANTLFATKKFLVVEGVLGKSFHYKEEFLKFLQNLNFPQNEFLIFVEEEADKRTALFKYLEKNTNEVYEFETLKGSEMEAWMTKKIAELGLKISRNNIQKISTAVLNDTWLAAQELQKLAAYAGDKEISGEEINALVMGRAGDKIFELTDAIVEKDKPAALALLKNQMAGDDSEIRLLSMIIRQFRIMLQIKSMVEAGNALDKYAMGRSLGIHHYAVQKTLPLVKKYSLDELKKIYRKLLEIDVKMKSSRVSKEALLDMFVMEL
ncbi:MAG: DNA polymerase III subunit delta [Patescibacteria group bacterium]|nr:DNA polymerase III subunit delta [Patescibacteria group bacterium]